MNTYTSQQIFPICMQPKQNTPIPGEDNNASKSFGLYKDDKSTLEEQDIEKDHTNLVGKSLGTGSYARDGLSRCTPQDGLFASESLLFLRKIRFSEQVFPSGKPVLNIKYYHLGS